MIGDRDEIRILVRPIADHPAIRIGYVSAQGKWGFWIVAIFAQGNRYVINAKFPRELYQENLPDFFRKSSLPFAS